MSVGYTTNLALAQPVVGTEDGTWGDDVNNGLTSYLDIAVAGSLSVTVTVADVTLTNTQGTSSATNIGSTTAQYAILNVNGAKTAARSIIVPNPGKTYIVNNAGTSSGGTFALTVKCSSTSGITLIDGERAVIAWNGSDYAKITSSVVSNYTGTLAIANGGTGATTAPYAMANLAGFTSTATAGATTTLTNTSSYFQLFTGTLNQTVQLPVTSTLLTGWMYRICNNSTGTLTVNSSGSNLVISVPTNTTATVTCIGTTLTTAADWDFGISDLSVVGTGVTTALAVNVGSSGAFTTNNAANTFTAAQTFSGSTSAIAAITSNIVEPITVAATAATGTINFDVTTQSVVYYTTNASANWTVNFRGSSGTSLNTLMSTGQSITTAFMITQGSTAYYNSAVTIDGTAVTPKWQGGAAPTAGNASSIDAYTYTIIKTGSAAFTVFASQTKFA